MRRSWPLSFVVFALALSATSPVAADAETDALFREAVASVERGAWDDAIDRFESLADKGYVHPDASFDRALAYVERARSSTAKPGDLGRAAAALEEALAVRPGDEEAERALERVRGEIARRRAREGADPVVGQTTLSRAVVGLLPEDVWAVLAALGSVLSTLGLAVRRLIRAHRVVLAGTTSAAIGAFLLLVGGSVAALARHHRLTSRPAVVVVPDARLLDESGRPIVQKGGVPEHVSAPEGTSLFVRGRQGELYRVEWGPTEAFVTQSHLYVLQTR